MIPHLLKRAVKTTRSAVARALSTASVHANGTSFVYGVLRAFFPQSIFKNNNLCAMMCNCEIYDMNNIISTTATNTIFLSAIFSNLDYYILLQRYDFLLLLTYYFFLLKNHEYFLIMWFFF